MHMRNAVGSVPYVVIVRLQLIIKWKLITNFRLNQFINWKYTYQIFCRERCPHRSAALNKQNNTIKRKKHNYELRIPN